MSRTELLAQPRSQPKSLRFAVDGVDSAIERGLLLVARVEALAASLAFSDFGDLDLPPEASSAIDQASVEAAASLYLAAELESTGLLPAVELMSGLFASGALSLAIGTASDKLAVFWRGRNDRFSPDERCAFFARLFGSSFGAVLAGEGGANRAFVPLMVDLTEALTEYEGHPIWASKPGAREETRVRTAGRQLASNLIPRSGGMTPFAARDILTTAKEAIGILKEPSVQSLFGANSVWGVVRNLQRRYSREDTDIASHLTLGETGQAMLAWLAGALPKLADYSTPILAPGHEVIAAAAGWLQASLALVDRSSSTARSLERSDASSNDEIQIYEATLLHSDQPQFPRLPAPGNGEEVHSFIIPAGKRFSRWEIGTIESGPVAGYEVKRAPERGSVGDQAMTVSWWHPPFGKIHVRIRAYASTTGTPSTTKVSYDSAGWLEQCRDQLKQGVPLGIAVKGQAAEQLHAALEKAEREHPQQMSVRPFVAGVDDAVILAVVGAVVLVVIAGMGFLLLYNIIQSAMEKGYDIRDTSFKVGGGEGPTRVDSEIVFNLIPPGIA
jgi:hypothetical protein